MRQKIMATNYDNSRAQELHVPAEMNTASIAPYPSSAGDLLFRFVSAGLLTGITDFLFACVLSIGFYHSTFSRLWQGVASVPLGPDALNGGARTTAIGVLIHFGVAFGWSAVFLFLVMRLSWVRAILASRFGVAKIAAIYGPLIWMVMSLVVIPILLHRAPSITSRWWIQGIGHFPFVGLPIVACCSRAISRAKD